LRVPPEGLTFLPSRQIDGFGQSALVRLAAESARLTAMREVSIEDDGPETRFAWLAEDRVAFQVFGDGEIDLLYVSASGDPVDLRWNWPPYAHFLRRLGTFARVITFDPRGMGSSDRPSRETLPSWEQWVDDARAVLDTAESERAVLFGLANHGPIATLFAASHPTRTRGLILANTAASGAADVSEPTEAAVRWDPRLRDRTATQEFITQAWGTSALVDYADPDAARDRAFVRWSLRSIQLGYSPRDASEIYGWETQMDVRSTLPAVRVPTLVLHRGDCQAITLDNGRYLAAHIPGAQLVVLPGRDINLFTEPVEPGLQHVEMFLRGLHGPSESDRALAAILFTDFVRSTERLSALGDHAWRNLLDSHDVIARTVVEQHSGRLIKTTGDGVLATFDGAGRAIRCAIALRDALRPLGLEIRAGLHTGEVEVRGTDIAGIAVHIATRVLEAAGPGELLVSAAVPMLVAGAGFEFDDRGNHELKGIDGAWQLLAVRT
jgi:class 3 adenylate cyclase/alpha-beta hydrolase superfamily lysophospholipase